MLPVSADADAGWRRAFERHGRGYAKKYKPLNLVPIALVTIGR